MILLNRSSWEIRKTKNKGQGLFAKKDIDPGVVIGDYLGKVLRNTEIDIPSEKESFYLMYYHDRASIYPDLKKPGVHLFNHSCEPNCALFTHQGHILFFSLRHIFAGEELTVAYMLSPKDNSCKSCTHICKCRSKFCTGSMHLSKERYIKWQGFQDIRTKKSKRKRISYNKDLPPLSSYPKLIPDQPIYNLFGTTTKPSKSLSNTSLPSVKELREFIRETGRTLEFSDLNKRVVGIQDNLVISESFGD